MVCGLTKVAIYNVNFNTNPECNWSGTQLSLYSYTVIIKL